MAVPALVVLLARIADGDAVVQHRRHAGQIARELATADDEQSQARAMHGAQRAAVEAQRVAFHRVRDLHQAGLQIECADDDAVRLDCGQQFAQLRVRRQWLEHDLHRPAAGEAEALRLLGARAVGRDPGAPSVEFTARDAGDQVVLDAAARQRSGDLSIVADDHQRARRPWRRAPGAHHRAERDAVAAVEPVDRAAQDLDVHAVHARDSRPRRAARRGPRARWRLALVTGRPSSRSGRRAASARESR